MKPEELECRSLDELIEEKFFPTHAGFTPYFSSFIGNAWKLIDKMPLITGVHLDFERGMWLATLWFGEGSYFAAEGDTPSRAICLAALKILEKKDE